MSTFDCSLLSYIQEEYLLLAHISCAFNVLASWNDPIKPSVCLSYWYFWNFKKFTVVELLWSISFPISSHRNSSIKIFSFIKATLFARMDTCWCLAVAACRLSFVAEMNCLSLSMRRIRRRSTLSWHIRLGIVPPVALPSWDLPLARTPLPRPRFFTTITKNISQIRSVESAESEGEYIWSYLVKQIN